MRLAAVLTALGLLCAATSAAPAAVLAPPSGTYAYRIHHPDHGEIGTYTNRITRRGDTVNVDTEIRIAVAIAFVTVYRLEADRHEQWRDGRLIAYSSVTAKNGKTTRVEGRAEADAFLVEGPKGRFVGPAGVWPANPWSPGIVAAEAIMGAGTGRIYEARVSDRGEETVEVNGRRIPARRYGIVTNEPHELWFDALGRLVKFTSIEDGNVITLTLQ